MNVIWKEVVNSSVSFLLLLFFPGKINLSSCSSPLQTQIHDTLHFECDELMDLWILVSSYIILVYNYYI